MFLGFNLAVITADISNTSKLLVRRSRPRRGESPQWRSAVRASTWPLKFLYFQSGGMAQGWVVGWVSVWPGKAEVQEIKIFRGLGVGEWWGKITLYDIFSSQGWGLGRPWEISPSAPRLRLMLEAKARARVVLSLFA